MRTKKGIGMISTLCFLLILLASCTQPVPEGGGKVGYIRIATAEEKKLEVIDADGIDHYEYRAKPLFSFIDSTEMVGSTIGWTRIEAESGSSSIIGPFSQGRWHFDLRALNPAGLPLWEGEGEGYIEDTMLSVITIPMHRVQGNGEIEFRIDVPETSSNMPDLKITIDGVDTAVDWRREGTGTGTMKFTGFVSGLTAGWHCITLNTNDENSNLGEAVAVEIVTGEVVVIQGRFEQGDYEQPHFTIDNPQPSRGRITRLSDGKVITKDSMEKGQSHRYRFDITSGHTDATVSWYINGEKVGQGAEYTFTPDSNGIYEVSALALYNSLSPLGGTYIEESTSSSVTVIVQPNMSSVTWDMVSSMSSQLIPYNTVITLGAPVREGFHFSHWHVTEGTVTDLYPGDQFVFEKPAYVFTAVWTEDPSLNLELTSDLKLVPGAGHQMLVGKNGAFAEITSKNSAWTQEKLVARWFLDDKEVFWICDLGNGRYRIPSASDLGMKPGRHNLTIRMECGASTPMYGGLIEWQ